VHQNLVQDMWSIDTGCVLDLGYMHAGMGCTLDLVQSMFQTKRRVYNRPSAEHVSDQVQGVQYIRPSGEHVSDQVQGVQYIRPSGEHV
jgi:hypothetical protein